MVRPRTDGRSETGLSKELVQIARKRCPHNRGPIHRALAFESRPSGTFSFLASTTALTYNAQTAGAVSAIYITYNL